MLSYKVHIIMIKILYVINKISSQNFIIFIYKNNKITEIERLFVQIKNIIRFLAKVCL